MFYRSFGWARYKPGVDDVENNCYRLRSRIRRWVSQRYFCLLIPLKYLLMYFFQFREYHHPYMLNHVNVQKGIAEGIVWKFENSEVPMMNSKDMFESLNKHHHEIVLYEIIKFYLSSQGNRIIFIEIVCWLWWPRLPPFCPSALWVHPRCARVSYLCLPSTSDFWLIITSNWTSNFWL